MNAFIVIAIFIVFVYTVGFALSLWKQKNKIGAMAVLLLAVIALVLPYFSYFQS